MSTDTAIKERGILFSGGMVRAILDGRKVQTRRVVKPQPILVGDRTWTWPDDGRGSKASWWKEINPEDCMTRFCPYQSGQHLWVRETWAPNTVLPLSDRPHGDAIYRADGVYSAQWKPSIHMPRWASRITLEVVSVRIERLQSITEEDAIAEGVQIPINNHGYPVVRVSGRYPPCNYGLDRHHCQSTAMWYRSHFASLWDSINAERPGCAWKDNPFVWCISFRRIKP